MIQSIKEELRKLEAYTDRTFPIVSVYLPIHETKFPHNPALSKAFTDLVEKTLREDEQDLYRQDLDYIAAFLPEYKDAKKHKGIALFSGGNKLWEVITTPFTVKPHLAVGHSPYLTPLFDALSDYERYLIVLADREKARFLTFYLGRLEAEEDMQRDDVHQKFTGRGAPEREKKVDNQIRDNLSHHFDHVGEEAEHFVKQKPISAVVVGGHKTVLHDIEQHLPKTLRDKVVGELIVEPDADMNEILAKSRDLLQTLNHGKAYQTPQSL